MKRKSSLTIGALLLLTMTTLPLQGNAEEKESEHLPLLGGYLLSEIHSTGFPLLRLEGFLNERQGSGVLSILAAPG